jgi:hypothetical protein
VNACGHTYMEPQTSNTRSRGLGRRIHGSVEDTKLSTNKQHCLSGGEQGYPARVSKVMTQPLLLRETDTCMLDIVQERVSRVSPASAGWAGLPCKGEQDDDSTPTPEGDRHMHA